MAGKRWSGKGKDEKGYDVVLYRAGIACVMQCSSTCGLCCQSIHGRTVILCWQVGQRSNHKHGPAITQMMNTHASRNCLSKVSVLPGSENIVKAYIPGLLLAYPSLCVLRDGTGTSLSTRP
jgi:hypothetical protein